jgi:hypothetical protein
MTAILQLNLPIELQDLIRDFVYYSRIEHVQRKKKKYLLKQIGLCERLYWGQNPHYDYFYFKTENWNIHVLEKDMYFISQNINVFSCIFCKECHEYIYTNTSIPQNIMCGCLPIVLGVD